jgi:ABC-type molybdenum transport system ATPase subunit/photorepair protein PhrA/GNAT superfamily N-acetyltransferase
MRVDLTLSVDIERTPRAVQLEGIFDVPEKKKTAVDFHFDVPIEEKPWQIGLIVGPSGAGKTSVARHLFGDNIVQGYDWHPSRSLVDSFNPKHSIRDVTGALSAVGFSSPPSWLKPFRVLSNGEQFRSTMARALLDDRELIVVDEFTSVIDRTVAQIGSCAISKAIRRSPKRKFIAVSCHDDIVDWLQPDWILEPHAGRFAWRLLQRRPAIELEIRRIHHSAWHLFAAHHYLTADICHAATCFGAFWQDKCVCFDAWLPMPGLPGDKLGKRGHRTVTLPDYQGVGIGRALVDTIASMWAGLGYSAYSRTAHPAEMRSRIQSPHWRQLKLGFNSVDKGKLKGNSKSRTTDRRALSSIWVGQPMEHDSAIRLLGNECC